MIKKSIWQKQLPTILGLGILIVALVVGVVVFTIGGGPGVFAPRATAQTTPKKIKITNITDTGFTISFLTEEKTPGFVKYGTANNQLKSQSSDDRDQLAGTIGSYNMHHITVRGLQPNTKYFYLLGTGSSSTFDNNGAPFEITTTKRSGAPSAAKTAYGNVLNTSGGPADGAVVYLSISGVGEMSSLVKNSGSWAIPLSNARTSDGSGYAQITNEQPITIQVQGTTETESATLSTTVEKSQPVTTITLAAGGATIADTQEVTMTAETAAQEEAQTEDQNLVMNQEESSQQPTESPVTVADDQLAESEPSTQSSSLDEIITESTSTASDSTIVDVDSSALQEVTTAQPTIIGTAAANITVSIEIHSDTQITQQVTTKADGTFELDLTELKKTLEPGEHTVTISYVDPNTGKTVTKTQTFTVAESDTVQLAQVPYGSGNPYPINGTSSAQASSSASPSPSATASARTSMPSTSSGLPVSGSVGSTFALVIGGIFFCLAGLWSFWIANEYKEEKYIIED